MLFETTGTDDIPVQFKQWSDYFFYHLCGGTTMNKCTVKWFNNQ